MGDFSWNPGPQGLLARVLFAVARRASRRALPVTDSDLRLACLDEPVEVVRDAWDVPAVLASSERDAFRVQGFIHASERMFQMDIVRRVAAGRLSEVAGRNGIPNDRIMRTLGLARVAREELDLLESRHRDVLEAYAEGVNEWQEQHCRARPLELRMLRYDLERWEPHHSLMFGKLIAFGLSGNWESELVRAEIAHHCGADVLAAIDGGLPASALEQATAVGRDIERPIVDGLRATFGRARDFMVGTGLGSNSWAVGGERTASGHAIIANDPHLDIGMPALWFELVLRCPTLQVRGFSVPGTPGVMIGHNGRIAWGITNSCADVQDLFVERSGESPETWRDVDGSEHAYAVREERIKVRFGRDEVLRVRSTRRGPIITDAIDGRVDLPMSIRWDSTLQPRAGIAGILDLNRAQDWEQFRDALRRWSAPSLNITYADAAGNIGYQLVGEVPIRAGHDGSMPRYGDDPAGEWTGCVPFDELPALLNPPDGLIVTANNRIVSESFPHHISHEWMNGYRAARIRSVIEHGSPRTVEDEVRLQADVLSIAASELLDAIVLHEPSPSTPAGRRAWKELQRWDRILDEGSIGSRCYRALVPALQAQVYGFLGEGTLHFLGHSRSNFADAFSTMWERTTPRIVDAMRRDDRALLDVGARQSDVVGSDGWAPAESWGQLVARALDRVGAIEFGGRLAERRSPVGRWIRRRHRHGVRLQHPFTALPVLGRLLSRGPYPIGGDPDTVWQASCLPNRFNDAAMAGPTLRYACDFGDLDGCRAIIAGGQSGHPTSDRYDDQVGMWLAGEARRAPWSTDAIRAEAVNGQWLRPMPG